ncbi:flagellar hook-associated protein 2 [Janthinobacterium sp. CG_23.3]|uniref:flagellar filament capping protein FliD n=1 Tax=unclassified Janthinobacterium TaxID=2610881 RepID=UPI0003450F80|nr:MULTISPECIES: flagellar filament capping protein FliD [unclassified Janthinobacterium]MEC5160631.1 flagellar hook-associated protein 2 [Janthinobacterium sp. CG_S6]
MTTTAPVPYNVDASAKAWTDKYTVDQQALITFQTRRAATTASALTSLKTAITAYQTSLTALTANKTLMAQAGTLSNPAIGSATAAPTAAPGTYSFFVESLATKHQVSYGGLSDDATPTGNLALSLADGSNFTVNMAAADKNNNGTLTAKEIAAAINAEPTNLSKVTASIITIGGVAQLVLTSNVSGSAGKITLDASALSNGALKTALTTPANVTQLVAEQDAVVYLGGASGTRIQQSSNTFTNIADVAVTFTKAQAPGDPAVTLTVGLDGAATNANVQSFVDAYNKLKGVLDDMTDPGDPQKGVAAGPFAEDSGMRVLRDQMTRTLRENSIGAMSTYGITATREGKLSLDTARLGKMLAVNPAGLDAAIGSTSASAPSGVTSKLDKFLKLWNNGATGQLVQRQAATAKQQMALERRQADFEKSYVAMFNSYKLQFGKLNQLQDQMARNNDMFDALFSK